MTSQDILLQEKHPFSIRVLHWLNVGFLCLMIWSGILIYWAYQPYFRVPDQIGPVQIHHHLALGMGWHFFILWPFCLNGLCYVFFLVISGHWKHLWPRWRELRMVPSYLAYDLKLSSTPPPWKGKYNPVQKLAYTMAIILGAGSLVSGLAIWKPVQLAWLVGLLGGYQEARFWHFLSMWGLIIFIAVHLAQVIRSGWQNFQAMVTGYEAKN